MTVFNPVEKSLWLQRVCEANYGRLARLIPDLRQIGPAATARVAGKPALHLRLIERSPHTLVLELTHDFAGRHGMLAEPAVRIRVCLDARTVEMLSDEVRPRVHEVLDDSAIAHAVLDYKWTLNYFLSRWLDHCLAVHYRFQDGGTVMDEALISGMV